jgi:hypothetical protein
VLVQPVVRRDDQLLALARELRRHVVDAHGVHVETLQVEVEAAQRLRRARRDQREPVEVVRRRVVAQRQVVVADVVAAVPLIGEVRVAEACGPRRRRLAWRPLRVRRPRQHDGE